MINEGKNNIFSINGLFESALFYNNVLFIDG